MLEYTTFVLAYVPYGVPYVLFVCAHIFVAVIELASAADKLIGNECALGSLAHFHRLSSSECRVLSVTT